MGRIAFFSLLYPFYTRLKKNKLLDNFTRGRIYGHIESNPGIHYSELLRDLDLGNGALAYHLKTLERERMIRSEREGQMKKFYTKNGKVKNIKHSHDPLLIREKKKISKTRSSINNLISSTPGLMESEIADWLKLSKQNVHYHVKELEKDGIVRVDRTNGHTRCYNSFDATANEGNGGKQEDT